MRLVLLLVKNRDERFDAASVHHRNLAVCSRREVPERPGRSTLRFNSATTQQIDESRD